MKQIECATSEIVYSYEDYLKTKHWNNIKNEYRKRYKYQCTMCFRSENLHLHHMTYENIGHEKLVDLVYLCETCHTKIHKTLDLDKTKVLGELAEFTPKTKYVKADCKTCFHYDEWKHSCNFYRIKNPNKKRCPKFYPQHEGSVKENRQKPTNKNKPTKTPISLEGLQQEFGSHLTLDFLSKISNNYPGKETYLDSKKVHLRVLSIKPTITIRIKKKNVNIGEYEITN